MTLPRIANFGYGSDAISNPASGLTTWDSADGLSFKLQKDDGTVTQYYTPARATHGAVVANSLQSNHQRQTDDGSRM